jgi:hypothetical protein
VHRALAYPSHSSAALLASPGPITALPRSPCRNFTLHARKVSARTAITGIPPRPPVSRDGKAALTHSHVHHIASLSSNIHPARVRRCNATRPLDLPPSALAAQFADRIRRPWRARLRTSIRELTTATFTKWFPQKTTMLCALVMFRISLQIMRQGMKMAEREVDLGCLGPSRLARI